MHLYVQARIRAHADTQFTTQNLGLDHVKATSSKPFLQ